IRKINQIYLLTWCILVAEIGAFLFTENGALLFSDYTIKAGKSKIFRIFLSILLFVVIILSFKNCANYNENKKNKTLQIFKEIKEEVKRQKSFNGRLPQDLEAVTGKNPLKRHLKADGWGNNMVYEIQNDSSYRITSVGPDNKQGTDDDMVVFESIQDWEN
ncbi:MAG: type II secretion system protein GspG, partial [Cytophagaceae bacterium]